MPGPFLLVAYRKESSCRSSAHVCKAGLGASEVIDLWVSLVPVSEGAEITEVCCDVDIFKDGRLVFSNYGADVDATAVERRTMRRLVASVRLQVQKNRISRQIEAEQQRVQTVAAKKRKQFSNWLRGKA